MSFEFQSTLVNVTPNYRIGGNQIGGVRIEENGGIRVARVIVTNDADAKFALSGPYEIGDPDGIYAALSSDLYEVAAGVLLNEGAVGSIEHDSEKIIIDLKGSDRKFTFLSDAVVTEVEEIADHTWKLPTASFTALRTAASNWRSSMDGTLEGLSTAITTEVADRIASITAEEQRVDALIASGMWLYADQASFPPAADNHGRVVHSHADGAIFYAHGGMWHQVAKEVDLQTTIQSVASEATARQAADDALDGRLDVLEADPTTATAVAAGDAATLSSANTYTDGEIATEASARTSADASLSGRLDVLEADPTTATAVAAVQSDVDQNELDSDAADAALSARLDVLEADPTTATALAAVQSDVDQNEADGDAADAALSGRLDVLEVDPTTQAAVDTKLDAALVSSYILTLLNDNDAAGARTTLGLGDVATTAAADYATAAQGALADTAVQPAAISNIDNTSDADKPVSTAQQAALDLRALLDGTNIPGPYADDTAAAAGGVAVGALYKANSGQIHYRVS